MSIPKLSSQDLEKARTAATLARRKRAELKEQVRLSNLSLAQALDTARDDEVLRLMKVADLLLAVPRVGERRAVLVMESLSIAPNRRVRGLGRLQIAGLKAEFGDR
ncbi:MAG: 30S ribosomal protein S13 [Propionibacteriaceae bacterium]|nr:30S ribosomal protein S13 [Propionibacteriaceae bacterium]